MEPDDLTDATLADVSPMASVHATLTADERVGAQGFAPPLPRVLIGPAQRAEEPATLELLGPLGDGGMGIVHLAREHALDREVAVKRLTALDDTGRQTNALLREARIIGRLEHPNIVPVHSVGVSDELGPLVVMKRISGVTWDERLEGFDPNDPERLAAEIEVLLGVCDALHFAHEHGVVHRDVKPANVMLGDFGEVYLVDWGVALDLRAVDPEERQLVGTPSYMAPEMLEGRPARVDRRTDVYLAGAVLHRLLFGRAPHDRDHVHAALASASMPLELREVEDPLRELAAVCRRACAFAPDERFATAADLAVALRDVLRHRDSERLVRMALDERARIEEAYVSGAADAQRTATAAGAVRHGLDPARALWPENPRAGSALRRVTELEVRAELDLGHASAARALLDGLEPPAVEMLARLELLEREQAQAAGAQLRLVALERERDLGVEVGHRRRSALALFGVVALFVISLAVAEPGLELVRPRSLLLSAAGAAAMWATAVVVWRRRFFASEVNTQITIALCALFGGVLLSRGVGWLSDVPSLTTSRHDMLIVLLVFLRIAAFHRGFLALTGIAAGSLVISFLVPDYSRWLFNVAGLVALILMYMIWSRIPAPPEESENPRNGSS